MVRLVQNLVIVTDDSTYFANVIKFITVYAKRFGVTCCFDSIIIYYNSVHDLNSKLDTAFANVEHGAIVLLLKDYIEEVLQEIFDSSKYKNHDIWPVIAYDIDEKKIKESTKPNIWENIYIPGIYMPDRENNENIILRRYINKFYGRDYKILTNNIVTMYESLLFMKNAVELTNSVSGFAIRSAMYGRKIDTPEGPIALRESNHFDHHASVGKVVIEEGEIELVSWFEFSESIIPTVYLPLFENGYYACDCGSIDAKGKIQEKSITFLYIGNYNNQADESFRILLILQGMVNSVNSEGGVFGYTVVYFILFYYIIGIVYSYMCE